LLEFGEFPPRKKKRKKRRKGNDDGSDDDESTDDEQEKMRKERLNAVGIAFDGTGEGTSDRGDQGATAIVEIDTDFTKDHRATEEMAKANRNASENPLEDKTYKGMKSYAKYIEKKDTAAGSASKMTATGPQRAPSNVRSTVRWDYEPSLCKDFKETGYCGFGDSCKFMHDRSDYKFGWQLEREMQDGTYGASDDDDNKYVISSDEEDLPFKCFLCKASIYKLSDISYTNQYKFV
jgi:RING finger protein 113A